MTVVFSYINQAAHPFTQSPRITQKTKNNSSSDSPTHSDIDPERDQLPDHLRQVFTNTPRPPTGAIHHVLHCQNEAEEHKAFAAWFRSTVITCPVIAALVLHSGYAAHPYRFLQLLSNDSVDGLVSDHFQKGEVHIANLKKISRQYINMFCDEYSARFQSTDPVITSCLRGEPVKRQEPIPSTAEYHKKLKASRWGDTFAPDHPFIDT